MTRFRMDMTHLSQMPRPVSVTYSLSCIWHDSLSNLTCLSFRCDMAHSHMWRDFLWVWRDVLLRQDSLLYVPWPTLICSVTSFGECDVTHYTPSPLNTLTHTYTHTHTHTHTQVMSVSILKYCSLTGMVCCVCVNVCVKVCVRLRELCACVRACVYMYVYVCAYVHACVCLMYMYVCMHVYILCICISPCIWAGFWQCMKTMHKVSEKIWSWT